MKTKLIVLLGLSCCSMIAMNSSTPPTLPPRKQSCSQKIAPDLQPKRYYPSIEFTKQAIIDFIYKNKKYEEPTTLHFSSFTTCAMESVLGCSEGVLVCDGSDGCIVKKFSLNKDGILCAVTKQDQCFAPVSCAYSCNGTTIACGTDQKIVLYTANRWNANKAFLLPSAKGTISALALDKTGDMVLASQEGESYFSSQGIESYFNIITKGNSAIREYKNNSQHDIYRLAFSPNGKQFVSVNKEGFMIWDITEDTIVKSYESQVQTHHNCKIEYCGDTEWFLTGYNDVLNVWMMHDLNKIEIHKKIGLNNECLSASSIILGTDKQSLYAYDRSSCGRYIFVEDSNRAGYINIFNLDTHNLLRAIDTKKSHIFSLLYIAEGTLLVAGIQDSTSEVSLYNFIDNEDLEILSSLLETKGSEREIIQKFLDPSFNDDDFDFNILPMHLQKLLKKHIPRLNKDIWHMIESS